MTASGAKKPFLEFRILDCPEQLSRYRRLVCPQCGELLLRGDVEGFSSCPFCLFRFKDSPELEDFILEPEVDSWMKRQPGFTFRLIHQLPQEE